MESQVLIDAKNICEKDIMNYQKKRPQEMRYKTINWATSLWNDKWFCDGKVEPDQAAWEAGKCGQERKEERRSSRGSRESRSS